MASQNGRTIGDLEKELAQALAALRDLERAGALLPQLRPLVALAPPAGGAALVELRYAESGYKIAEKRDSTTWRPESGLAEIRFGYASISPSQASPTANAVPEPEVASPVNEIDDCLCEVVDALSRAERHARFRQFVALKKFRDEVLPQETYSWAGSDADRRSILARAIEERAILTAQVHNPKSPAYPVTTVRVNRDHPAFAGNNRASGSRPTRLAPVAIQGTPLSTTIASERG